MDRILCSLAVVTVLTAIPNAASAQDSARDTEARQLFEAGQSAFADGRYEDALERFRDAYQLSSRPQLLYNIGTTAERLQRDDEALEAYEAYVEAQPQASNRREVEARIRILRDNLEEDAAEPTEEAAAAPEGPADDGGRVWTWVLGAGAVMATALGVTGRLLGNAEYDDLVARCTAIGGCTDAEVEGSSVKRWERLTVTSFVFAGAFLVGTLVALFIEGEDDDEPAIALDLGPTGLVLRGAF